MQKVVCNWMECDNCGASNVTVVTDATKPNWFYDGDHISCNNCQAIGEVYTDDGIAFPVWESVE